MNLVRLLFTLTTTFLETGAASNAMAAPAPLGVTYAGWRGEFANPDQRLATFKEIGFQMVSFVPTYAYTGLNKIDLTLGPDTAEMSKAIVAAVRKGFKVVIKPHLDPLLYSPGFDGFQSERSENDSWRVHCSWRGFFDIDPMSDDYKSGVVFASLRAVRMAIDSLNATLAGPVRLELGAELMNAMVYAPERWVKLLVAVKKERHRLGLDQAVVLSHNFTHHFEIADDYVARMSSAGREMLKRYIRGLDAIALSQYMDLTAAMPADQRKTRLPSADEVAQALLLHERNFRQEILIGALGLRPADIPPLHIGEFGIGRGGLRHPNLWADEGTPAKESDLAREITRGHEGLLRYLALREGRIAQSAILWVTGSHYDIFGWENQTHAIPEAAAAIKAALSTGL